MKLSQNKRMLIFFTVFLLAIGWSNGTLFDIVQVTKRVIIKNTADSIYSVSSGTIGVNGTLKVKSLLMDTNLTAQKVWRVSPAFTFNKYRLTSSSIQMAIDSSGSSDSTTILIYDGYYNERLTLKSRLALIGTDRVNCKIVRVQDSTVIYANGKTNIELRNLTIINKSDSTSLEKSTVKFYKCATDSLSQPRVRIDNCTIEYTNNVSNLAPSATGAALNLFNSSVTVTNSYIHSSVADYCVPVRLADLTRCHIYNSQLVNKNGSPQTGIFLADDTAPYLYIGYNEMYSGNWVIFHGGTANFRARAYFNISDIAVDDVANGTVSLIINSNNVGTTNFYLP